MKPSDTSPDLDAPTLLPGNAILQGKLPDRVGPFEIKRLIGEGGMGVVGLGIQTEGHAEKRRVAVKFLKRDVKGGSFEARLFEQECRSLARFSHDNIARFIDFGYHEGNQRLPYIVMEYVENAVLITDHCAGAVKSGESAPLPLRQRLDLFLRACDGIRHAHERNIVHGDISSKNILIGRVDGDPVVKIIDFGIALHAEDKDLRDAGAVGTPAYMSPEQLHGDPTLVDQRSDIYALGIVLCEIMVGRRPYNFQSTEEAKTTLDSMATGRTTAVQPSRLARDLSIAGAKEGVSPRDCGIWRRLARELRGDLDAIVAKATALDPDARYPSVAQLAEDIVEHLAGRPLKHAIRPSATIRLVKFVRRNAVATAAAVVVLALLASLASLATFHYRTTLEKNTRLEEANRARANTIRTLDQQNQRLWSAQQTSYATTLSSLPALIDQGKLAEARALLASTRNSENLGWEWDHLLAATDQSEMVLGHSSSGFTRVIDAGDSICAAAADHSIWFWNAADDGAFRRVHTRHQAAVLDLAAKGDTCHSIDAAGHLLTWSSTTGEFRDEATLEITPKGSPVLQAAISTRAGAIAAIWRAGDQAFLGTFRLTDGRAICQPAEISAEAILCWRDDDTIHTAEPRRIDEETQLVIHRPWPHTELDAPIRFEAESVLTMSDGTVVDIMPAAIINQAGRVFLKFEDGLITAIWENNALRGTDIAAGDLAAILVSEDASSAYLSLTTGRILRYDCEEGTITDGGWQGTGHRDACTSIAFSRGESRLLSASLDGTIRLWNPAAIPGQRPIPVGDILIERVGNMTEEALEPVIDDIVNRYKTSTTAWCRIIEDGGRSGVLSVFDAPPWILLTNCETGHTRSCPPPDGVGLPGFLQSAGATRLGDAPRIVTAGANRRGDFIAVLRGLDSSTGTLDVVAGDLFRQGDASWTSEPFKSTPLPHLAVSNDGRYTVASQAAADASDQLVLWDSHANPPRRIELSFGGKPSGTLSALRFSPSGRWLAAGNTEGTLFLWRCSESGVEPAGSIAFQSWVRAIAFSHQDDKIAVALARGDASDLESEGFAFIPLAPDGTIGKIETPVEPLRIGQLAQDIAWNRAGTRLASADNDGRLRVWAFRRDADALYLRDCRLVLEFDDAHVDEYGSPLYSISWSGCGCWLAAANPVKGGFLYHATEDSAARSYRRATLEFDDVANRSSHIANLRFGWRDIPELKNLGEPEVVARLASRIGTHPGDVTRWAWAALARMKQLSGDELFEARRHDRERYLNALRLDSPGTHDAARHRAIALANYRLNRFREAREALARARTIEPDDHTANLLDALIRLREGGTPPEEMREPPANDPARPLWMELMEATGKTFR